METLTLFVETGQEIEVVVLEGSSALSGSEFANIVESYRYGRVITQPAGVEHPVIAAHMLLAGDEGRSFHLEVDRSQTKAIASFNNLAVGVILTGVFESTRKAVLNEPISQPVQQISL